MKDTVARPPREVIVAKGYKARKCAHGTLARTRRRTGLTAALHVAIPPLLRLGCEEHVGCNHLLARWYDEGVEDEATHSQEP
jgi:hypothetical protein